MRTHKLLLMAALAMLTVLSACGSGGGGGETGPSVATNLHAVFFRTLTNAPVQSVILLNQIGTPIAGDAVTFDTRVDSTGNRLAGQVTTRTTEALSGRADVALPAGTYPVVISAPAGTFNIGGLNDKVTVANTTTTYQTSQQTWNITAPVTMRSLTLTIFQTDASGNLDRGTTLRPLNPQVLSTAFNLVTGGVGVSTATITTELFKGTYRSVIKAVPFSAADALAPYVTPASTPIIAAGGGATETVPQITLPSSANVLNLTLFDGLTTAISSTVTPYKVDVYDKASLLLLGTANTGTLPAGNVVIQTGDITNIVAIVTNMTNIATGGSVEAIKAFTASISSAENLHKFSVNGNVAPPAGGTLDSADLTMSVAAKTNPQFGIEFFDKTKAGIISAPVNSLGVIQMKVFEGPYTLSASINKFPDSDKLAITVSGADLTGQTINVRSGGIITGRIQDQSKIDIANVLVQVVDATTNDLINFTTTSAQGTYTVGVPFGTYNVFVNGAVTRNIVVNTDTVTKNFTQFNIQGRLTDSLGGGLAGAVLASGGNATAGGLGTFSIKLMEGENWVWFTPPASSPSLGFAFEPAVLIDANTITTNLQ
jgi:hypothetical protein